MSKYTASICTKISIVQVIACQDNLCELQVTEILFLVIQVVPLCVLAVSR